MTDIIGGITIGGITIGGITIVDPLYARNITNTMIFIGTIGDMPFFTNYMRDYLRNIQDWLQNNQKPPLTSIRAIRYLDKYDPRRFLTRWVAFSDDLSIGWYKYAGLVAGGTYHKLLYDGEYRRVPGRQRLLHRRRRERNN